MTEALIRGRQNEAPAFLWPGAKGRPQDEMVFVGVFVPDLKLTFASGRNILDRISTGPNLLKVNGRTIPDKTRPF